MYCCDVSQVSYIPISRCTIYTAIRISILVDVFW